MSYDRACLDTVHHRATKNRAAMHLIRRAATMAPSLRPWATSGATDPAGSTSPDHIPPIFPNASEEEGTFQVLQQIQIICAKSGDRKSKWSVKSAPDRILGFLMGAGWGIMCFWLSCGWDMVLGNGKCCVWDADVYECARVICMFKGGRQK